VKTAEQATLVDLNIAAKLGYICATLLFRIPQLFEKYVDEVCGLCDRRVA